MKKNKTFKLKSIAKFRSWIQGLFTLATNPHLTNFMSGKIHNGSSKGICAPGLNCYSCPAASNACPVGAYQAVANSSKHHTSFYILGFLSIIGLALGRFVCGFLCPFGWFQDLLFKIPSKKIRSQKLKFLRHIKYLVLVITLVLVPVLLYSETSVVPPYFCKWVCPQGILEAGIPLSIARDSIRNLLGTLFFSKLTILLAIIIIGIFFSRPFCKWLCPLGAFYGLFNKISLLQYNFIENKCIDCKLCLKTCPMDIDIRKGIASPECIRCGGCINVCPTEALEIDGLLKTIKSKERKYEN